MIATWQAPCGGGNFTEELVVSFDQNRERRVLILPALFDEANKLRRFTIEMMRAADARGVDTFLPDLPGCNESLAPLESQTLAIWREAAASAVDAFSATHVLTIRAGALLASEALSGWQYAPQSGSKLLRGMLRARTIASREAGKQENSDKLLEQGRKNGLMLGGWQIGPTMIAQLESADLKGSQKQQPIAQKDLGGAGLWLRAEPGEDANSSEALAAMIADDAGEST
jgi:hypothetical protein